MPLLASVLPTRAQALLLLSPISLRMVGRTNLLKQCNGPQSNSSIFLIHRQPKPHRQPWIRDSCFRVVKYYGHL